MPKKIAVLGGGAAGVGTALALVTKYDGLEVHIFEKREELLQATSNATPGRMGLGFHYKHPETGKMYMDSSLILRRRYSDCMLGYGQPEDHYLKRGYYAITKIESKLSRAEKRFASQISSKELLKTYEQYREHYAKRIKEEKANYVCGNPNQFFTVVPPKNLKKFKKYINTNVVDTLVDTREELVDWPKLRRRLIKQVQDQNNIIVHTNTEVYSAKPLAEGRFGVVLKQDKSTILPFDAVVNCLWEHIEKFDEKAGFKINKDNITYRLKTIVKVKLPDKIRTIPSFFFCLGPHCMLSNLGNGYAMMTYAPATNITQTTSVNLNEDIRDYLRGEISLERRYKLAGKVVAGVQQYIPSIKGSTIHQINFGIIKTQGSTDIFDPNSDFHKRDYLGVEKRAPGWVSNSCMKLMHFEVNGNLSAKLIMQYLASKVNSSHIHRPLKLTNEQHYPLSRNQEPPINEKLQSFLFNKSWLSHITAFVLGSFYERSPTTAAVLLLSCSCLIWILIDEEKEKNISKANKKQSVILVIEKLLGKNFNDGSTSVKHNNSSNCFEDEETSKISEMKL